MAPKGKWGRGDERIGVQSPMPLFPLPSPTLPPPLPHSPLYELCPAISHALNVTFPLLNDVTAKPIVGRVSPGKPDVNTFNKVLLPAQMGCDDYYIT